ncbi:MAG: glycosyltransferase family 4 protein [Pseudomonadota bacterium]
MKAAFAIPGDPATPTGGYVYDARVIEAAAGVLELVALPAGFPFPSPRELEATGAALAAAEGPALVDGLAYGALPPELIDALPRPPVALCHHPLGLEAGLSEAAARRLIESERAALARAAHVVVTSDATKRTLLADFGLEDAGVTVAEPGLDRTEAARLHGREPDGPPKILTVASITPRKGHDALVSALAALGDRDWTLDLVGPEDRDAAWATRIREAVACAGLEDRVAFRGAAPRSALEARYLEADLFCLSSRYEGYGMVFAEAMMRGLPVVGCAVGAVPEVVPPAAGRLVPPDDPAALAEAIAAFLDDPAARRSAGAAGRAHALSMPGWDATWAAIRKVLEAQA